MTDDSNPSSRLLDELARDVRLREGPAGVERFLWAVAREPDSTSRHVARRIGLPVPVVAALRRELEKRGCLVRGKGMRLSDQGRDLVRGLWGDALPSLPACPHCGGSGILESDSDPAVSSLVASLARARPPVDVRLDQAHLEPDCLLRKARLLLSQGCILGRRVLFLGDDDFLSLALLAAVRGPASNAALPPAEVLEIDLRIVDALRVAARQSGLPLIAHSGDARHPLPHDLRRRFDTVVTDPPYTIGALEAFLDRAVEALDPARGGLVALSFGRKSDRELVGLGAALARHRLALRALFPAFNRYLGAAILGGVSDLYLLALPPAQEPSAGPQPPPFYTADARTGPRWYRCLACGQRLPVGPGERFETVSALAAAGCPACGKSKFRYTPA